VAVAVPVEKATAQTLLAVQVAQVVAVQVVHQL
jgi:hypothetical protein